MSEALIPTTTETAPVEAPALPGTGSPLAAAPAGEASTSGTDSGTATVAGTGGTDTLSGGEGGDSLSAPLELKLPEGVEVDPAAMTEFQEFAKTNGLSPETTQAALDMHLKMLNTTAENFAKAQKTAWDSTIEGWKTELAKNPDFSGEKKNAALQTIGKAFDEYGSPEARQAFEVTGAGWNPAIIAMVHKMAVALSEGTAIPAGSPARGKQTPAEIFYGATS